MRSLAGDVIKHAFNQQTDEKLHRRLYAAICSCILEGSLKPATRMPPSRDLAGELTLSRNTVLRVYEQLQAEGYISARTSSGTFVTDSVLDNLDLRPDKEPVTAAQEDHTRLSARCLELLGNASASPRQWGAFIPGVPDVEHFPHRVLKKIQDRLARRLRPEYLTYDATGGVNELKEALADYLRTARGVRCSPEQILITEGIHQALDLVTRTLCNPGDHAWIEEPGYWGIKNILRINAVNFSAIPVDEQGMVPPDAGETPPKLIFVTPSHQYPLGSVMSLSRRRQLLFRARETRSWMLEEETPVIYIGTFSKTLYPALRLGYVVLPKSLAAPLKKVHNDLYRGGHLLIQAALAEFIREGYYAAHIRKMRQLYSRRRQMLVELISRQLGEHFLGSFSSNAGLHMILQLPSGSDDAVIAQQANAQGLLVRPLSRYYVNEEKRSGLLLGFASIEEHEMTAAFTRLVDIIRVNTV